MLIYLQRVIVCPVNKQFAKLKYGGDIGAEHAQDEDGVEFPVLDPGKCVSCHQLQLKYRCECGK